MTYFHPSIEISFIINEIAHKNSLVSVLIIPGYQLYPISTGAGLAQFGIIDKLRQQVSLSLLLDETNVTVAHLDELKSLWPEVQFYLWSDIHQDYTASIQKNLISRLSYKLKGKTAPVERPALDVPLELKEAWGNTSILFYPTPEWKAPALHRFAKAKGFDIVQTDLPVHLPLAQNRPEGIKYIHVCHELKSKRFRTSGELLGIGKKVTEELTQVLHNREAELLQAYDQVLCFNSDDQAIISRMTGRRVEISPFPVLDTDFASRARQSPSRLIFLGPEAHGPNVEGLDFFLEQIRPQMKTGMPLHVIGNWSEAAKAKRKQEGLIFEGFVEDLQPFFEDGIMLVPVLSGAGIRTKIIQAMAQGVPVLATRFAAQGIDVAHGEQILFFENAQDLGQALSQVRDQAFRTELITKAQAFVQANFSQRVLGQRRLEAILS